MTDAIEAIGKLIELVRDNDDIAHHAEGCDLATVGAAERELGIKFPPSYRRFIKEFGTCDIAGEEFLGVYQTPAMGEKFLGSVAETLDARSQYAMPSDLIVAMFDGMGGLVVLDASRADSDGEYPILVWNPGITDRKAMEEVGGNFGSFALQLCQRAVTNWRESN
ncbi:SMI1/KNR4 family protein [Streptomyces sp. ISL-44]|uniref:SMI1/KNR4 family protein n=1 Tax=Streptomyces sp. ISL-44 TaxID=2819184 RepID=UPI001BE51305|nr:SMI1/KNR4 family protein [Streptomyces sp. ISL-44]MBT2545075.1 SMI1/KNR4 family protein [Streptomyces sp. ISL-44]